MVNIIGQSKLLSRLNSYSLETLPKALMFIGPVGCGKHTITKYIAERFDLEFQEINNSVNSGDLEAFLYSTISTLYLVDLDTFTEKQQNQFLKFIEEPSKSVYVVLIASSETGVLNTLLNRCIKYTFDHYTKQELETITNSTVSDTAFEIFKTPGKLLNLTVEGLNDIVGLAEKIVYNINYATYPNALVVSTKLNYKDLYNKIDPNMLLEAVEHIALKDYTTNNSEQSFIIFNVTSQFKQYITKKSFIKEMLIINYLTALWEAVQK